MSKKDKILSIEEIIKRGTVDDKKDVYIKSLGGSVTLYAVDFSKLIELRQVHGDKFQTALVAECLVMPYSDACKLSKNPVVFQELLTAINETFAPTITDNEIKN